MKLSIVKGTTSQMVEVFIQDTLSAKGAGLTDLVYNSTNLTAYYYLNDAASSTAISLATMTLGTWATGGFVEVDATNMPGVYSLGIPNAALTGADSVVLYLFEKTTAALNMAPVVLEIQLTGIDVNDGVRGGMTALPNAAADAAGGLPISDAGGLDLDGIETSIGNIPQSGGTTSWNATALAAIESECDDALVGQRLDHLCNVAESSDVASNSIIAKLASSTTGPALWSSYNNATDSLQAIADGAGGGGATAQEVWDFDVTGTAAGATRAGNLVTDIDTDGAATRALAEGATGFAAIDTVVDTINTATAGLAGAAMRGTDSASTHSAADVWTSGTRTLTANTNLNDLDAAGVAAAVWNAATVTYDTAGSYGLLVETNLDAAVSTAGGDDAVTIWTYGTRVLTANTNLNDISVNDIWDETMTAHVTADSAAVHLKDTLADTNELQTDNIPGTLSTMTTTLNDIPTVTEFNARTLVAADYFDWTTDAVANVTTTGNVSGNVDGNVTGTVAGVTPPANTIFTGMTSLTEWLGLMAGKQAANATALTEIKASGAGSGTYSETTDSLEAIADGGGGLTAQQVWDFDVTTTTAGVDRAGNRIVDIDADGTATRALAEGATGFAAIDTVVDTINSNVGTAGAGLTNLGGSSNNWNTVTPPTLLQIWQYDISALADVAGQAGPTLVNVLADTNELQTNQGSWLTATSVTVSDKTGFSLAPTTGLGDQTANITGNLSGSVGSVSGAVGSVTGAVGSVTGNVGGIAGTINDFDALDTALDSAHGAGSWAAGSTAMLSGTADSGSTTTIVDAAGLTQADTDYWKGAWVRITSGTSADQVRLITGFDPGTDTITFAPALTQAVTTNTYEIVAGVLTPFNVTDLGNVGVDWANVENPTTAQNLSGTNIDVDQVVASVSGAVGSVTAKTGYSLASSGMDSVTLPADLITAASINTGAFTADAFAANALVAATFATSSLNGKGDWSTHDAAAVYTAFGTGSNLTAAGILASSVGDEVDTSIEKYHLDHLLAVDYDPASKPGTATALLNELIGNDAGVSQFTANALALAPSSGGDATEAKQDQIIAAVITNAAGVDIAADIASAQTDLDTITDTGVALTAASRQAMVEECLTYSATATIGSVPKSLAEQIADNASGSGATAAQVWAYDLAGMGAGATLAGNVLTDVDTDGAATRALAEGATGFAAIDTVVDAILVDTTAIEVDTQDLQTQIGTAGAGLSAIPLPSWASTITEFWHHPEASITTADTIGLKLKTNLDVASSTLATSAEIATAQTDLDTITGADGALVATDAIDSAQIATGGKDAISSTVWSQAHLAWSDTTSFGGILKNLWSEWQDGNRLDLLIDDASAASHYTYFTSGTNPNVFKANVSSLALEATVANLNDFDPAADTVANVTTCATVTNGVTVATNNDKTDYTLSTAGLNAVVDQTWQETLADHSGVSGSTAEAMNAASSAGDPWTTALPGAYGAGSAGYVIGNMLDASMSSRSSQATQDIMDAIVDQILLDTTALQVGVTVTTNSDKTGYSLTVTPPTSAAISDAVWVEILADHSGVSGSVAEALNSASSAGDPWTTTLPGSYTGTQAGAMLNNVLTATGTTIPATLAAMPTTAYLDTRTLLTANYFNAGTDGVIVTTNNDKADYTISTAGMNAMSDVVWEEAISDHSSTSGSVAESLNAAGSAGDPWTTTLPGSYTGSQAGKMLSDIIVDSAAIDAVTSQFVFTVANQVDANALTGGGGDDASTIYNYFTSGSNENPFRADVSGLATSTALATAQTSIDAIPLLTEIWGAVLPASYASNTAGGLLGSQVTTSNPVLSSTVIELDEGDTYDGTARAKLAWVVSKDYTTATSATLEIWRAGDAGARTSMKSATATVADATNINIADLDAGTWLADLVLAGCPAFEKLSFALVADWSGSEETIAKGDCYVYGRE